MPMIILSSPSFNLHNNYYLNKIDLVRVLAATTMNVIITSYLHNELYITTHYTTILYSISYTRNKIPTNQYSILPTINVTSNIISRGSRYSQSNLSNHKTVINYNLYPTKLSNLYTHYTYIGHVLIMLIIK